MQSKKQQLIWQNGKLLSPGCIRSGDRVYNGMRLWEPESSKLVALCYLGYPSPVVNAKILYLGAASGTTVSFVADYAEVVYAVEFSRRPMGSLINLAEERDNIIPIFADARHPDRYSPLVEKVDLLIQDIAQRDQVEIFNNNLFLLKEGGRMVLFLKMLCMGIERNEEEILNDAEIRLSQAGIKEISMINMERYYRGHIAVSGYRQIYTEK